MIWSPARRFCFIHCEKTGGTSIERAYLPNLKFGDIILAAAPYGMDAWYSNIISAGKHSSAFQISKLAGEAEFHKMLSVSVVRDPVDRMVSFFRWIHSLDHRGEHERNLSKIRDFSEFIDIVLMSTFMRPQSTMVRNHESGALMIDYLIPFPRIAEGWGAVASHLVIDTPLPHVNASKNEIAVEITNGVRQKIYAHYANDLDLYNHAVFNFTVKISPK